WRSKWFGCVIWLVCFGISIGGSADGAAWAIPALAACILLAVICVPVAVLSWLRATGGKSWHAVYASGHGRATAATGLLAITLVWELVKAGVIIWEISFLE